MQTHLLLPAAAPTTGAHHRLAACATRSLHCDLPRRARRPVRVITVSGNAYEDVLIGVFANVVQMAGSDGIAVSIRPSQIEALYLPASTRRPAAP